MELKHYIEIFGRRKWIIIVTTTTTLAIVTAATFFMTPIYSTSATVRIAQIQGRSIDYIDLNYSNRLINTYVELVRSRPFLEETIQRLDLDTRPADLANMVSVEAVANTELLKITVESSSPEVAMLIANTLGELLVGEREKLYSGEGKSAREILFDQLVGLEGDLREERDRLQRLLDEQGNAIVSPDVQELQSRIGLHEQIYGTVLDAYESARLSDAARANSVSVVVLAAVPDSPVEPNMLLNIALGAVVGLAGGIGLAFLFENIDTAMYSPDELKIELQASLLGSIPELKVPAKLRGFPLLVQPNGKSSGAEAFRVLRSNVLTLDHGRPPGSLLVTSIEEGAGKSSVLINLAVALGQARKNIVAIDSDLRNPSLSRVFKIPNDLGLKNVIDQDSDSEDAIQETKIPGVRVLTSGPKPHNPAELLGLASMKTLITDLANWADFVLLDSPPLTQFSDAVVLAPLVDGVLLVVSRGGVSAHKVESTVELLKQVGAGQIGIVFNRENS